MWTETYPRSSSFSRFCTQRSAPLPTFNFLSKQTSKVEEKLFKSLHNHHRICQREKNDRKNCNTWVWPAFPSGYGPTSILPAAKRAGTRGLGCRRPEELAGSSTARQNSEISEDSCVLLYHHCKELFVSSPSI